MKRIDLSDDTGSTIPLILGFFLIGLLVVAGSVTASDAFTKQRDLQSVCDGTAIAAANSPDLAIARGHLTDLEALPLGKLQETIDTYVSRDPSREGTAAALVDVSPDGAVTVGCHSRTRLAFGGLFGLGAGVDQKAYSTARSPLG
jgi:hypothetical protein